MKLVKIHTKIFAMSFLGEVGGLLSGTGSSVYEGRGVLEEVNFSKLCITPRDVGWVCLVD